MTAREVARMFAGVPHVWEGIGVHEYRPTLGNGCAVCEGLDAILIGKEYEEELNNLQRFWETGTMAAVNLAMMHPRGYALAVALEDDQVQRLFIVGDGSEPWCFADDVIDVLPRFVKTEQDRADRWEQPLRAGAKGDL